MTQQAVQPYQEPQVPQEEDEWKVGADYVMQQIETGEVPMYIRKLYDLDLPPDEKESLLSIYLGVFPRKLDLYINEVVEVQGVAILPHGDFKGKDGTYKKGYYKTYILTTMEDDKGNPVVLASSGGGLTLHMAYAMEQRGWYIWDKPVRYKITRGDDGSHRMRNLDKPKLLKTTKK